MKLRERKPNRHKFHDYSSKGYYFVTICTQDTVNYFGEIVENEMKLNKNGKIAFQIWQKISNHFDFVETDEFVVMPNHIHGIIIIVDKIDFSIRKNDHIGDNDHFHVGGNDRYPLRIHNSNANRNMELLPKITSQYKSTVTRIIRKSLNDYQFAWQRSFHDRIIRNQSEYINIKNYIINNPSNWHKDRQNI